MRTLNFTCTQVGHKFKYGKRAFWLVDELTTGGIVELFLSWKSIRAMDAVELQKNIEEQKRQNERLEKFIQKAKHYQDLNSLTPDALRDMVSAIYVGAPDKSSGKRQQKIEIYYDGAGFIPLNLLMQRETA